MAMIKAYVEGKEAEELKRLYPEYIESVRRAGRILVEKGMGSPEFAEADHATSLIVRRIREILD